MSKNQFKKWVKFRIEKAAFKYLIKEKEKQSKIQHITYSKLEIQNYLKSKLFSNDEIEILSKLRSQTINLKANFKKMHFNKVECSIEGCFLEKIKNIC